MTSPHWDAPFSPGVTLGVVCNAIWLILQCSACAVRVSCHHATIAVAWGMFASAAYAKVPMLYEEKTLLLVRCAPLDSCRAIPARAAEFAP